MKDQKRKVFFSSLQVRIMMSHELETDPGIIRSEVFDRIVAAYNKAEKSGMKHQKLRGIRKWTLCFYDFQSTSF